MSYTVSIESQPDGFFLRVKDEEKQLEMQVFGETITSALELVAKAITKSEQSKQDAHE